MDAHERAMRSAELTWVGRKWAFEWVLFPPACQVCGCVNPVSVVPDQIGGDRALCRGCAEWAMIPRMVLYSERCASLCRQTQADL